MMTAGLTVAETAVPRVALTAVPTASVTVFLMDEMTAAPKDDLMVYTMVYI